MKVKLLRLEVIVGLVVCIFLSYVLLFNPIIGKHNNGDFGRTIYISGLVDLSNNYNDIYDGFVHSEYKINYIGLLLPWGYDWTSEVLLIKLSILLNILSLYFSTYYIKFLAIIYILFFSIAVFLIIKYYDFKNIFLLRLILSIVLIISFTDIGYISYFNSFFGEAASFVFIFLIIGTYFYLISQKNPNRLSIILFMTSSIFFLTSKAQNIPLVIFMFLLYFRLLYVFRTSFYNKLLLKLVIVSLTVCVLAYLSIGHVTTICNKYQSIFTGVLKDSPNVEKDLNELGLDKSYKPLAGTNFFTPNMPINPLDPSLNSSLYSKINSFKTLKFYILNPERLFSKVNATISHSFVFFTINEGNYEKNQFSNNKFYNSFRTFLSRKFQYLYQNIVVIIVFTLFYYIVIIYSYLNTHEKINRLYYELFFLIGLFGTSQLILPIIGSGEADFEKHLFLLNLCYDIMFSISFIWVIWLVYKSFCIIWSKIMKGQYNQL